MTQVLQTQSEKISCDRRLMLFDLALGGHHGNYIRHLIEFWCDRDLAGSLDIVVLPQFLQVHSEVVDRIAELQHDKIRLVAVSDREEASFGSRNSTIDRTIRNFREWKLFGKYATALQADHALLMYFDTCELPLALGIGSPCPFSGIYFRATFHYNDFSNQIPYRQEKLQQWREKFALRRILHHPQMRTLFCLDPFAAKYIEQWQHNKTVVPLPDPVETSPIPTFGNEDLRDRLGIGSDRKVFLFFGALDRRKGIDQLLDAISLLPNDLCDRLCLLLVGPTSATEKAAIQPKIVSIRHNQPVEIVEQYDYVPEPEVSAYFQLADVVLAPYQRHVGMSGILLLAAAAGKPVLSSNYGLMGEVVRRYQLGIAVDSTIPAELAKGLTRCLEKPLASLGDRAQMQVFAERNSVERYASTIFQHLDPDVNLASSVAVGEA
jgi:glycosyltransferase involved in cell wall biosynthesis